MRSRHQRGFTILELMITVAIAAIILGLGLPSLSDFIQRSTIRSSTLDTVGAIAFARSEAVTRRENIIFQASNTDLEDGWEVVDSGGNVLREGDAYPSGFTVSFSSVSSLTFTARGRTTLSATETLTISDSHGNTNIVQIPLSGSPVIQ